MSLSTAYCHLPPGKWAGSCPLETLLIGHCSCDIPYCSPETLALPLTLAREFKHRPRKFCFTKNINVASLAWIFFNKLCVNSGSPSLHWTECLFSPEFLCFLKWRFKKLENKEGCVFPAPSVKLRKHNLSSQPSFTQREVKILLAISST